MGIRTPLVLGALGGIGIVVGTRLQGPQRNAVLAVSGAALGWGVIQLITTNTDIFAGADIFNAEPLKDSVKDATNLSPGAGSFFERILAGIGNLAGAGKDPGVTVPTGGGSIDRPADERAGPFLGRPKNALLISGTIRQPAKGEPLKRSVFATTFTMNAAVENQGKLPQTGRVGGRILVGGGRIPEIVRGGVITLQPGEFREVILTLPAKESDFGKIEAALLWDNHNLDSESYPVSVTF